MKVAKSFLVASLLIGSLGASAAQASADDVFSKEKSMPGRDAGVMSDSNGPADGILLRQEVAPGSNIGHLRFPAIREETLGWDRPLLKDPSSGDIIDFYGSLDHDPAGKDEIRSQRSQLRRELRDD